MLRSGHSYEASCCCSASSDRRSLSAWASSSKFSTSIIRNVRNQSLATCGCGECNIVLLLSAYLPFHISHWRRLNGNSLEVRLSVSGCGRVKELLVGKLSALVCGE
jgi:hypothetical protein